MPRPGSFLARRLEEQNRGKSKPSFKKAKKRPSSEHPTIINRADKNHNESSMSASGGSKKKPKMNKQKPADEVHSRLAKQASATMLDELPEASGCSEVRSLRDTCDTCPQYTETRLAPYLLMIAVVGCCSMLT